ncbi:interferon phi 1 [Parambassis ranga]|uniref:Interferon phi 1 n=1 Tax=Parambassis ranga TaxID=210632 RepID=A0A6P7IXF6_9TELE|nr:interferon a3-like [Parambassis ranga]
MPSCTSLLFILCSVLNSALCCDWLRNYGHLNNNSQTLIKHMGGPLTEEESPVPFPYRLYELTEKAEMQSQLVFIRYSLEMISGLYRHDNLSIATWDTIKTEHFLMSIDRQIEELNHCVSTKMQPDSRLRRYYRRLAMTLHHTGGSAASWELIRKETEHHLIQLEMLVASIRRRSITTTRQH